MRSERRTLPARAGGAPETTSAWASHDNCDSSGAWMRSSAPQRAPNVTSAGLTARGITRTSGSRSGPLAAGIPSACNSTTWLLSSSIRVGVEPPAFGSMRTGLSAGFTATAVIGTRVLGLVSGAASTAVIADRTRAGSATSGLGISVA